MENFKFSDSKMDKIRRILIKNGRLTASNNYIITGVNISYYSPDIHEIVCMDIIWGYPRYVYDGQVFYKKNIEGKIRPLTRATLINSVLNDVKYNSKLSDYDDEGKLINAEA